MIKKSPSGSLCPYYYMDGELHPLKYGSFLNDKIRLFEIIKAEEEFILKSSGKRNRRIWIDLYETNIDNEVIEYLVFHLMKIKNKIFKLCLVGCSKSEIRKIRSKMKKEDIDLFSMTYFFDDPEEAKQWLIGKTQ